MTFEIHVDDLSGAAAQRLVRAHLKGVHELSPPESVHALDLEALRSDELTVWSAWRDGQLVGIGALKQPGDETGEIKSMRVDDRYRGTGAGRALLRHIVAEAAARGIRTLYLETGSEEAFVPARGLYASEGFIECGPFGDYRPDPLSVFMRRDLPA
jgi:putative acetyltransferase